MAVVTNRFSASERASPFRSLTQAGSRFAGVTAADFHALAARVFEAYEDGNYAAALAALNGGRSEHPDRDSDLTFWAACLRARLGETNEALAELQDGIKRGLWWSPGALVDSDLDPVRSTSRWKTILSHCEATAAERLTHRPGPLIASPITAEAQSSSSKVHERDMKKSRTRGKQQSPLSGRLSRQQPLSQS